MIALHALLAFVAAQTQAPAEQSRSVALNRLVACQGLADGAARLACFDREVAALDQAEQRRDVVVVDREQLRKTRRTLFGLTLPNLSVFGDDDAGEEGVTNIEATIRSADQDATGKWRLELDDGAVWQQIDSREFRIDPRAGHKVSIRRAAMGSYLANVNGQIAVRVRRQR